MPNYKKMYLHMVRETEKAIQILIAAQQECEEMYICAPDPEIMVLPENKDKQETVPDM